MTVAGAGNAIKRVTAVIAAIVLPGIVAAGALQAQITNDSILEERTKSLAAELRCPVCQGLSIQDSPSELAQQMKQVVREQLREGKSPEEVKAYFVSKYGEWVLLEPKPHGMNLAVYLLPVGLLIGGAGLIVVVVRRWTAPRPPTGPAAESELDTETETETEVLR